MTKRGSKAKQTESKKNQGTTAEPSKAAPLGLSGWLWGWIKALATAAVLWFLITSFLVKTFHIPSSSMEHTLLVGDLLVVNKLLYGPKVPLLGAHLPAFREPRLHDIIVFDSPIEDVKVVKRIIGVPGDTLAMVDGQLFRNGTPDTEPFAIPDSQPAAVTPATRGRMRQWQTRYLTEPVSDYDPDPQNWGPIAVPPDSFFVMGDNRGESLDSRYWGFLPRENVVGTPMFIYYSYDPEVWKPFPFITAVRWGRLFSTPD